MGNKTFYDYLKPGDVVTLVLNGRSATIKLEESKTYTYDDGSSYTTSFENAIDLLPRILIRDLGVDISTGILAKKAL